MRINRGQLVRALVGVAFALPMREVAAQRRSPFDMPVDYIVAITEQWGAADTRLGDLREKQMGSQDIELRFWGGYGLAGTRGIIMTRTNGTWIASRARVRTCQMYLAISVADTLSEASEHRYQTEAKRKCNNARTDSLGAFAIVSSDTLDIVSVPVAHLERVWNEMVRAGITTLPTSVWRPGMMLDGHTYVAQLRMGPDYRVSRIEHWSSPETMADKAIQRINAILSERIGWDY